MIRTPLDGYFFFERPGLMVAGAAKMKISRGKG